MNRRNTAFAFLAPLLLLAACVRFFHYALFWEVLLSARNYLVDFAVLLVLAALAAGGLLCSLIDRAIRSSGSCIYDFAFLHDVGFGLGLRVQDADSGSSNHRPRKHC